MLSLVLDAIKDLANERNKKKHLTDGCDLEVYGAPIGKLRKLVSEFKLKDNHELVVALIESNIYDAVYLGFLALDVKKVSKEQLLSWVKISKYYKIRIHSLAYAMSEHRDHVAILKTLEDFDDDVNTSIYYAVIAGRIIIDPQFDNEFVISKCEYVAKHICDSKYQDYPMSVVEMNSLIGFAGMQIQQASLYMIELAALYADCIPKLNAERKLADQRKFINSCINSNGIGRKRKSARC